MTRIGRKGNNMAINTTIGALADASAALRKLAVQELPLKTAFRLTQVIRKADEHMEFYEERYNALLRKHCERRQEDGQDRWYPKSAEERAAFEEGLAELRGLDVELEITESCVIADAEGMRISCADMIALDGLVEFEFTEDTENG